MNETRDENKSRDVGSEFEIDLTPEMIEAGAEAISSRVGGCDLGGHFSAERLAIEVYRAMATNRS